MTREIENFSNSLPIESKNLSFVVLIDFICSDVLMDAKRKTKQNKNRRRWSFFLTHSYYPRRYSFLFSKFSSSFFRNKRLENEFSLTNREWCSICKKINLAIIFITGLGSLDLYGLGILLLLMNICRVLLGLVIYYLEILC